MIKKLFFVAALFIYFSFNAFAADNTTGLDITLKTDKQAYDPGSAINIEVTFKNSSASDLRILETGCYKGQDFKFFGSGGNGIQWDGRAHTVKLSAYPGQTHLIKPAESYTVKFGAFITKDRRLIFENHSETVATGYYPGTDKKDDIPDKYIGCGRFFDLKNPGKFQISYEKKKK